MILMKRYNYYYLIYIKIMFTVPALRVQLCVAVANLTTRWQQKLSS